MLDRLGRFIARRPWPVLAVTVLLVAGAAALGFTAFDKLKTEGFTDPGAESTAAEELIDDRFGGTADLVFLVDAGPAGVDDPAVADAGSQLSEELQADPALSDVTSYFLTGAPTLRSENGRYALVVADSMDADDETILELREHYESTGDVIEVTVGGPATVGVDITDQVKKDLALAEAIAVPLLLVLLLLAFRSVVAALLPLAIGTIAVFGTFALLAVLGSLTDVSIFSINLTTALGLGLAVDYALLMVSRFREELAAGATTPEAVARTVDTAGRTIAFSAATVAAALAVLLVFPLYFLRSFAYAGIGVVVIALAAGLLVLPALLAVLGPRIDRGRLPWGGRGSAASPFWGRVASTVTGRPLLTALPVLALLLLAAAPLLGVQFATPDDRVLSEEKSTRVVGDALREHFPGNDSDALQVVLSDEVDAADVADYAARLSAVPGVLQVRSSGGVFVDGIPGPDDPAASTLERPDAELLLVATDHPPESASAEALVHDAREVAPPDGTTALVGGDAPRLVDTKDAIGSRLPIAGALIALITVVVLFLFTGSVLQPLRALVLNLLSLSATLGLMVLIFQEGWFSGVLGHTALPLDIAMLVLLFCIVFGLSMDYEVFVLSRIKELHDQGADQLTSVSEGLARTGALVTTAAALLAVNFFAFTSSGVTFIQMFGLGSGIAILIDATLVRGVLVPAAMRLLGGAAWWSPEALSRLHGRLVPTTNRRKP